MFPFNFCHSCSIQDSESVKPVESYPQQNQGLLNDINKNRQTQKGLEGYLQAFLDIWKQCFNFLICKNLKRIKKIKNQYD
jgi:hypothetical protein